MLKNKIHPYLLGKGEEIIKNKTKPNDGKRKMFSSDHEAAES